MKSDTLQWWQALNPAIYLISILPAAAILIMSGGQQLWYAGLLAATLAVVLLQHAINLFNDISDWKLGADAEKMDSWVRVHDENTGPVLIHAVISFISGGIIGLTVLFYSDKLSILLIAIPLIGLGYLYNAGKRPLSYTWMGEWVTGICYGGVFGCLWIVAGLEPGLPVMYGTGSFAALATSLLLSHQPSQIETDKKAGKHSFAVRYGKKTTQQTSLLLFLLFALLTGMGIFSLSTDSLSQWFYFLPVILAYGYLRNAGVNPRRILLCASFILAVCFIFLTIW